MEFFKVLSIEEALASFFAHFQPGAPRIERVSLFDAPGRILAGEIRAGGPIPGFDRASMDGYAVRAADTYGASEGLPALMELAQEIRMGEAAVEPLLPGRAAPIATGGMLPPGADAVVMIEYTEVMDGSSIAVYSPVAPGENVVEAGEDVKENELLLPAGHRLRPQDVGALAGLGYGEVPVAVRPRVGIVATGNEVVPPAEDVPPGMIRDMNTYSLSAMVRADGGIPVSYGIVKDERGPLQEAIARAYAESDVLITSGGTSVGARDLCQEVLDGLGKPGVLVHGVSIKPGKPTIIGVAGDKPVFGLSGNPVSAMIGYQLFVHPALKAMLGALPVRVPAVVRARLSRNLASASGRTDFIRVTLRREGGELVCEPILGKAALLSTMVRADGLLCVSLQKEGLREGEIVEVTLFQ